MLRILIADGTPAAMQAERETFGIPSNASLFEAALSSQQPHIGCSSINVADGQDLAGSVYGGPTRMGKLLGPPARDRSTRRNRPPQSPRPRTRGGESDYRHDARPLPPASRDAAFRLRRSLLSYRRARTAAARRGGAGSERALSDSGAGAGTTVGKHFLRDAVPSRVHAIGRSRFDRDAGRKSRSGGVQSRLCRVGRYGPRFPRAARRAETPRPGLALRHRPRDLGSSPPHNRNRQLAAGSSEDF